MWRGILYGLPIALILWILFFGVIHVFAQTQNQTISQERFTASMAQAFANGVQSQSLYIQQLESRITALETEIKSFKDGK